VSLRELGREFDELRAEYRRTMPEKLRRMEKFWAIVGGSKAVGPALGELCRELHTIAGSAGSFGLPDLSKAALAAENHLVASSSIGAAERATMDRLLEEMKKASLPPS